MYKEIITKNGVDLVFYVPGYTKDDFEVTLNNSNVIIKGTSSSPYVLENTIYYKFNVFKKVENIDPEFINGILIVHIKFKEYQPRKFNIR